VQIWENPDAPLRVGPEDFRVAVDSGDWVRAFNVVMLLSALESDEEKATRELPLLSSATAAFGA
jgi:hypothetical protein